MIEVLEYEVELSLNKKLELFKIDMEEQDIY